MRDYPGIVMNLRLLAADLETAYGEERGSSLYSAAADAIEELLGEVQKWISVEERLPENGERVLIMFKPFEDDENISIGWLTKSGFDCYDDSVYFFRLVTHWMPLPEPPKGVE